MNQIESNDARDCECRTGPFEKPGEDQAQNHAERKEDMQDSDRLQPFAEQEKQQKSDDYYAEASCYPSGD